MNEQTASPGKESIGPGRCALQTSGELLEAIMAYYGSVKAAKEEGRPVIWSTGVVPREIFHAVDAPVLYLEHLPFVIGFQVLGSHYQQIAEEHGFSKDVCAFHRCFIGCGVAQPDEREPLWDQLFAPPDLIIGGNYPCISQTKSFLYLADQHKCPYYFIDAPINTWGVEPPDYAVEYYAGQLKGALDFMGEHGYKLDWDKLKENVRLSKEVFLIWREIDDLRKAIPTPMTPMDGILSALLLIRVLPPRQVISLLEKVRKEVKEKVERKEGAIENEKLRLLFYGVPPLFNMGLFDDFEKYGAIFAKSMLEGCTGGIYDPSIIDPEKPLESIAYSSLIDVLNPTTQNMVEYMVRDVKDYHIDGVVAVVKRSCGLLPGFARQIKDAVYKETGVPTTIFDLDGLDTREYDDATSRTNLDSFIETLQASKA